MRRFVCSRAIALVLVAAPGVAAPPAFDFGLGPQASPETVGTPRDPSVGAAERRELQHRLAARQVDRALGQEVVVRLSGAERQRIDEPTETSGKYLVGIAKAVGSTVDFSPVRAHGEVDLAVGSARGAAEGGFVWTAVAHAPGATALRLHLSGVDLPAGSELYVYNLDGQAFGPYTGRGPLGDGVLHTNTVFGEKLLIQLYHPQGGERLPPPVRIEQIGVMGKRFVLARNGPDGAKDFNNLKTLAKVSNLCSYNAECVVNAACQSSSAVDAAKDAVASILFLSGGSFFICTGGLIADSVSSSVIPYFLTANHCIGTSDEASSLETYFDYQTTCSNPNCTQPYGNPGETIGSTLMATGSTSDYSLVRLSSAPATPDGIATYLGWQATPVANSGGTALYRVSHPKGAPQAYSEHVVDIDKPTCSGFPRGDFIYSTDIVGAVEGGSSGSPVVNGVGQIVGQLFGACGFNIFDVCDAPSNATVDGAFAAYFSNVAPFLSCDGPGVPVIAGATATAPNVIDIVWSGSAPPADSFNVYRATGTCSSPGPFVKIADAVPGPSYQDTAVSGGSTYAYRVAGRDASGTCESAPSECAEATATGVCTLPPSFAGLASATDQSTSTCGIGLSWPAATPSCAGPVTYDVFRSTTSGFTPGPANRIATGVTGTSYTDTGMLTSGTTYHYVVRAVDTSNGMAESNNVQRSAIPTGPATTALLETFEGINGFDNAGWTHTPLSGGVDWVLSTAQSHTPTHSWYSASQDFTADRVLVSPPFTPPAGSTLSFWHTYSFEYGFDGGTLEISTDGDGSWSVIPDAAFVSGGFNETACCGPLGGERVWTGGSIGPMTEVKVDLGSFAGAGARLRWHAGEDSSVALPGWYVDSVTVQSASVCSPVPPTPLDFFTLTPCRLVDTRNPDGPSGGPALQPSAQRTFVLAGSCGVPLDARALSVNLTVTQPSAGGHLTLFPTDLELPLTSSINFVAGQTRANNAVVSLAFDGSGGIKVQNGSGGTVHFILDVNGYFQ